MAQLIDTTLSLAAAGSHAWIDQFSGGTKPSTEQLREQMVDWYLRVQKVSRGGEISSAQVEEWKKASFPHLADALFVGRDLRIRYACSIPTLSRKETVRPIRAA